MDQATRYAVSVLCSEMRGEMIATYNALYIVEANCEADALRQGKSLMQREFCNATQFRAIAILVPA